MTIRILIVDDDPLVRAGLSLILGGAADIDVIGEASDGQEALTRLRTDVVDVVLMDIRMPVMDGIDATAAITAAESAPKVIVLTTFDADDFVIRALAGGASGFLLKDTPPAQIVDAVHKVAAGEPMLSPTVTEQLIRQLTDSVSDDIVPDGSVPGGGSQAALARVGQLTDREREVAIAIGEGAANAEIAAALHMSLATVKAHVSHIFSKLQVSNRVQVAIRVHEAGLL